ncbi:hypothetical protein SCLCIDRAFT_856850 [Scleroderma citrinum Foug A]|uniref:Uncharacterized protein n=1 Tax=Scleroderma citrinum Foug A TaxID=1036808 RepID=A0A0C3AA96_9AGAM|nr:hypothetical protein SCLCIDRAFT_856850 [Scleroderma citrinum Foug A]
MEFIHEEASVSSLWINIRNMLWGTHQINLRLPPYEKFMNFPRNLVNFPSYSLEGAVGDTYTNPQKHTCNFFRPCRYPNSSGGLCGEIISCSTMSAHFHERHGIVNLPRNYHLTCQWCGCLKSISRHNFVRHVREQHLFHSRP